jgi:hypothetical protein
MHVKYPGYVPYRCGASAQPVNASLVTSGGWPACHAVERAEAERSKLQTELQQLELRDRFAYSPIYANGGVNGGRRDEEPGDMETQLAKVSDMACQPLRW